MQIRAISLFARFGGSIAEGSAGRVSEAASRATSNATFTPCARLTAAVVCIWAAIQPAGARDEQPGGVVIAGQQMSCRDVRGLAVHTMQVANLGDVGRAGVVNRVPIIVIDPHIIGRLPDKLQIFFYQHECGHHALGHWYGGNADQEKEADCWAIRSGREKGTFTRDDVMSFAPFLAASGGSPFGHLPGPQRAKFLLQCYDEPGDRAMPASTASAP